MEQFERSPKKARTERLERKTSLVGCKRREPFTVSQPTDGLFATVD
jgi:hypothetical protein